MSDLVPFSDLALAAYCPRKLYYRKREPRSEPPIAAQSRALALHYDALRSDDPGPYAAALAVAPPVVRERLDHAADRFDGFPDLVDPVESDVLVRGKDCVGRVGKVLASGAVSVVSPGEPPDEGVWETQSVRAVAAAKAVSWREGERVETAFVEYPRYGVVRRLDITGRRTAAYRRALRTASELDGPPARLHDESKCTSCEYAASCGVETRTLSSLL